MTRLPAARFGPGSVNIGHWVEAFGRWWQVTSWTDKAVVVQRPGAETKTLLRWRSVTAVAVRQPADAVDR